MTHIYKIALIFAVLAVAAAVWFRPVVINAEYLIVASGKVELHKWERGLSYEIEKPKIK